MKTINYCNLYEGRRFTVKGDKTVYVKVANSHAVVEETEQDAIFTLSEKCVPCGNNKALLHKVNDAETILFAS